MSRGIAGVVKATAMAAIVFCAGSMQTAWAFKPWKEHGHVGIVRDALLDFEATLSTGSKLKFELMALEQIRYADGNTDGFVEGEFWDPRAHCDDERLPECTRRLLLLKAEIISILSDPAKRDGHKARRILGRALHTLQDFYAHSNWANNPGPAHTDFNAQLGRWPMIALRTSQQTCKASSDNQDTLVFYGITDVTTGYFDLNGGDAPQGKCSHGLTLLGVELEEGINKDEPGRNFHEQARAAAVDGTRDYVGQIVTALGGNDDAIRALMGKNISMGFVVDDSASMGNQIDGVNNAIAQLVESNSRYYMTAPTRYVLATFNDPTIGAPRVLPTKELLLLAASQLRAHDGGDCPEMAMHGVLAGMGVSHDKGRLFIYTDASAKDSELRPVVNAIAQRRGIELKYFISGSCSPVDQAYYQTASGSGGALYYLPAWRQNNQAALLNSLADPDTQQVFSSFENLATEFRRYAVPVDAGSNRLTISVGTDFMQGARLLRPDGVDVMSDPAQATVSDFGSGAFIVVPDPIPGAWTFEMTGLSQSFVNAYVTSAISVDRFELVKESGRVMHTGMFPIDGSPTSAQNDATLLVLGEVTDASLEMRKLDGNLVAQYPLTPVEPSGPLEHRYTTQVQIPQFPVRFYVRGKDSGGNGFLRAVPKAYALQDVSISVADQAFELALGSTRTLTFLVKNLGAASNFRVVLANTAGLVQDREGASVAIGANETVPVTFEVTVPADFADDHVTFAAAATDIGDVRRSNSTSFDLFVTQHLDGDNDGVMDDADDCDSSILTPTVRIDACDSGLPNHLAADGCTVSDDIALLRAAARNHGDFVSSTSAYVRDLKELGVLGNSDGGPIISCAAQSRTP